MIARPQARTAAPAPFTAAPMGVLRRACTGCGGNAGAAGECAECRKKKLTGAKPVQRKLTIGASNDLAEREADRVADTVMRMPSSAAGSVPCDPPSAAGLLRRAGGGGSSVGQAPPIVHDVLASPGRPLDAGTRAFMEPRFGRDLSHVRVHADARAAESAAAVNAEAYTVGSDIVFGTGRYAPESGPGRRLLAHELAHVGQQGDGVVRRACNEAIRAPEPCTPMGGDVLDFGSSSDELFLAERSCDHFLPGEDARLASTTRARVSQGDAVTVHGFASEEGDAVFNDALSCARANTAARVIRGALVAAPPPAVSLFKHGATPGDRPSRRSVVIAWPVAAPSPPTPSPSEPAGPSGAFLDLQLACMTRDQELCNLPGGVPDEAMAEEADEQCRDRTGYGGPPVRLRDLDCDNWGEMIGRSLARAYPTWLDVLPDCPCTTEDADADDRFSAGWIDNQFIGRYHPGADVCYRSDDSFATAPGTSHRQQCCYDARGALITSGSGAGTPDVWSTYRRHQDIDVAAFDDIQDHTVYNRFWVPNNGRGCTPNAVTR